MKTQKKIILRQEIPEYQYLSFIHQAIKNKTPFKYSEINQLGARQSGKTTSDNIELVRAIIEAVKTKQTLKGKS